MNTSASRPTGGNLPNARRLVANSGARIQQATASRPQSRTPIASLIDFGQTRTTIIKRDLHDGRLHDIDMESVQMIKNKARRISIQKGAFGDVYFSMYSSHPTTFPSLHILMRFGLFKNHTLLYAKLQLYPNANIKKRYQHETLYVGNLIDNEYLGQKQHLFTKLLYNN